MGDTISVLNAAERKVKLGQIYQFDVANFKSKTIAWTYDLMLINYRSRETRNGFVVEVRGFNPITNSNHHLSVFITFDEKRSIEGLQPVVWHVSNLPNNF